MRHPTIFKTFVANPQKPRFVPRLVRAKRDQVFRQLKVKILERQV